MVRGMSSKADTGTTTVAMACDLILECELLAISPIPVRKGLWAQGCLKQMGARKPKPGKATGAALFRKGLWTTLRPFPLFSLKFHPKTFPEGQYLPLPGRFFL